MAERREKVILELDDRFTSPMLRAAAAAKLAEKEIDHLGSTQTRGSKSGDSFNSSLTKSARSLDDLDLRARRAERSSSLLVDSLVGLGPALIPLGAVAVPAIAGLSAELGFATAGLGTALIAVNGLGDGLKAVDKYQLEPTAQNLAAMNEELGKLGPSGQQFVMQLDKLEPVLKGIRETAQEGFLPGVTDGIDSLLTRLPEVRQLIATISQTEGGLVGELGKNLASGDFNEFFIYLQNNAKPILSDLGHTIGNVAGGLANLFVGFAPQEREFSQMMLDASRDFRQWADGLDQTQGFQDFVEYIHTNGPLAGKALASIGSAVLSVVEAAAPLSGPVLKGLTALANIVERIADSPVGTPLIALASGLALVNRALATRDLAQGSIIGSMFNGGAARGLQRTSTGFAGVSSRVGSVRRDLNSLAASYGTAGARSEREIARMTAAQGRLKANLSGVAKGGAAVAALAIASSGAADGIGLTNTASLALAGTLAGPWGAAIGAGVGGVLDLTAAVDKQKKSLHDWAADASTIDLQKTRDELQKTKAAFQERTPAQNLVSTGAGYGANASSKNEQGGFDSRKLDAVNKELELRNAVSGAANLQLLQAGFVLTARGADLVSESTEKFQADLESLNVELAARSSFTSYKSALLSIQDALKKNGRTLDTNTRAGLENRQSLEQLAGTALTRAKDLEAAGKRTQSIRFLKNAQKDLSDAAQAFGVPKRAADRLAARLLGLDAINAKPTITVVDKATGKISGIKAQLSALDNTTVNTYVKTHQLGQGGSGTGHATGGRISGPGGPTEDRIPAWLSNGEYVIKAAAVERYGPGLFDRLNAMAFAGGGYVSATGTDFVTNYNAVHDKQQLDQLVNQINDLKKQLAKKGKKSLKGGARVQAEDDLAAAQAELVYLSNKVTYDNLAQSMNDAADAADQLAQNRQQTSDSLFSSFDLFSKGTSAASAERYAQQFLSDVAAYSSALQLLAGAGAGVGVLKNVERVAESGDYKSAAKLARNLASNPAALGSVNSAIVQAQAFQSGISAIVNGSAFAATNAGIQGGTVVPVTIAPEADPNLWLAELRRTVVFEVQAQLAGQAT